MQTKYALSLWQEIVNTLEPETAFQVYGKQKHPVGESPLNPSPSFLIPNKRSSNEFLVIYCFLSKQKDRWEK
jgi:hypothetical protein